MSSNEIPTAEPDPSVPKDVTRCGGGESLECLRLRQHGTPSPLRCPAEQPTLMICDLRLHSG